MVFKGSYDPTVSYGLGDFVYMHGKVVDAPWYKRTLARLGIIRLPRESGHFMALTPGDSDTSPWSWDVVPQDDAG